MKNKNLFLLTILISTFLVLGMVQFVEAQKDDSRGAITTSFQEKQNIREKLITGEYNNHLGQKIKIDAQNNKIKLEVGKNVVDCERCNLTTEHYLNQLKIHATLSNGRNAEIKIMPDTASTRALERLRLKNCNESNNCTIQLKEVGKGNETKMAYQMKARKSSKIFGLFKAQMELETEIDAETGEVIRTKRPWWSFFSTEED